MQPRAQHAERVGAKHLVDMEARPHGLERRHRALPAKRLGREHLAADTAPAEVPTMIGKGLGSSGSRSAIARSTPT